MQSVVPYLIVGFGLTFTQYVFARMIGMDTVSHMQARGIPQGIPFLWHMGACLGDIAIVTPFAAHVLARYGSGWSGTEILSWIAVGLAASVVLHLGLYVRAPTPEAHVMYGRLTAAGWVHLVYMGLALGVVLLYYFATPKEASASFTIAMSVALGVHLCIGTHMILSIGWRCFGFFPWFGRGPDAASWITCIAVWGLLFWRTNAIIHR